MFILGVAPWLREKEKKDKSCITDDVYNITWVIVNFAVGLYALYLSFERNNGFNLGSFLAAFFLSWCYVVYALAVKVPKPAQSAQVRINTRNNVSF